MSATGGKPPPRPMPFHVLAALFLGASLLGALESAAAWFDPARRDLTPLQSRVGEQDDAAARPPRGLPSRAAGMRDLDARLALREIPADLDRAAARSHDVLKRSPAHADAWARLAWIDSSQNGELTGEGLRSLNRSFVAVPFAAPEPGLWRAAFTLDHWEALDDEAKRHLSRAIDALARRPDTREALQGLSSGLRNEEAAQFLLSRL